MCVSDPPRPGPSGLAAGRSSVLPFLPTLATALAVAGLSLLCREPAAPAATAPALPVLAQGDRPERAAVPDAVPAHLPAVLAFAALAPPIPSGPASRGSSLAEAPRAVTSAVTIQATGAQGGLAQAGIDPAPALPRRGCPSRCFEARRAVAPHPAPPARPVLADAAPVSAAPSPSPAQAETAPAERDAWLDGDVLPFAPDARAAWESVRRLGSRAARLGSAVADAVPAIR